MLPASAWADQVKVQMKGELELCSATHRVSRQLRNYEMGASSLTWNRASPGADKVRRKLSMQLN